MNDCIDLHVDGSSLSRDFAKGFNIAKRPDGVRPANRHDIGLAPRGSVLSHHFLQLCSRSIVAHDMDACAQQLIKQHISVFSVGHAVILDHVDEDEVAQQPKFGRCRRSLPGVIRLHRAEGDHGVDPLRQGVPHQELKLARLVATCRKPRTVVTLHIKRRTVGTQCCAQPVHALERCWQMGKLDARMFSQHGNIRACFRTTPSRCHQGQSRTHEARVQALPVR